jgi:hypothetical protein
LPAPLLAVDFDRLEQGTLPLGVTIQNQVRMPGVGGSAWRSDGFSSYADIALALDPRAAFTLSLWVALGSFPSDLEVPANVLPPSSIAQQATGDAGFDLHSNTSGRWGLRVDTP